MTVNEEKKEILGEVCYMLLGHAVSHLGGDESMTSNCPPRRWSTGYLPFVPAPIPWHIRSSRHTECQPSAHISNFAHKKGIGQRRRDVTELR